MTDKKSSNPSKYKYPRYTTSVDGFILSNARKIVRFAFGDFVEKTELDLHERVFKIYLYREINGQSINVNIVNHFENFFGSNWEMIWIRI